MDYIPADALDASGNINKEAEFVGFGVAPSTDIYGDEGEDSTDDCAQNGLVGATGYSYYFEWLTADISFTASEDGDAYEFYAPTDGSAGSCITLYDTFLASNMKHTSVD